MRTNVSKNKLLNCVCVCINFINCSIGWCVPAEGVSEEEPKGNQPSQCQRCLLQPPRRPAVLGLHLPGDHLQGVFTGGTIQKCNCAVSSVI